jgi:hypothetical protein
MHPDLHGWPAPVYWVSHLHPGVDPATAWCRRQCTGYRLLGVPPQVSEQYAAVQYLRQYGTSLPPRHGDWWHLPVGIPTIICRCYTVVHTRTHTPTLQAWRLVASACWYLHCHLPMLHCGSHTHTHAHTAGMATGGICLLVSPPSFADVTLWFTHTRTQAWRLVAL